LIKGYSGAIYKRFRSEREAHRWLSDQGWEQYADDASDISVDNTIFDRTVYESCREPGPAGSDPARSDGLNLPVTDIVDLAQVGPDSSVGKPLEVHGTSIQVETEILKILCPKGMTASAKKELMEASPDVLSLPGKLGSATNDPTEVMDQFAGAVNDITAQRAARTTFNHVTLNGKVQPVMHWIRSRQLMIYRRRRKKSVVSLTLFTKALRDL
jgi:hypothetical protein